jgi:hypothetical protein
VAPTSSSSSSSSATTGAPAPSGSSSSSSSPSGSNAGVPVALQPPGFNTSNTRSAALNGTFNVPALGMAVAVGPALFDLSRSLAWQYDAGLRAFTTHIQVGGGVALLPPRASNATDKVTANMGGRLTLVSQSFPGPGFSGNYTWQVRTAAVMLCLQTWHLRRALQASITVSTQQARTRWPVHGMVTT